MNIEQDTKVWFITGSSSGFGRTLAKTVLQQGDKVIATARKPELLADLITQYPETAFAVSLDVTNKILNYAGSDPWSWIDCNDLALVVATTLREAQKYAGQTIQLGYDGKTFAEIAQILTEVIGKPFYAEDRSREEFLDNVLKAGADSAYMNCVYNQFQLNVEGKIPDAGKTFDNFEAITGKKPMTWREFIIQHREELTY